MKNKFFNFNNKKLLVVIFLLLILITLLTKFYGLTDITDYSDTAKYFAGKYSAKIRSSHSYLFGFLHSPFVWLTNNFIIFKITSLIFLGLIIYSVYLINRKDKRTLWLMFLSPIVWYMAPWINPIQLSALLVLWAYFFINKFDKENKIKYLALSGILIGLGWAIWDTIFYFGFLLALCFLYNKKLYHSFYFICFLIIGLLPRLILDYYLFNFPFFSMFKSTLGGFVNLFGGIYNVGLLEASSSYVTGGILMAILVFLTIPIYFWILYKPSFFKENKKIMIFLSLSLLLIFFNPQIRYTLIIIPIMVTLISRNINTKQFKRQIIFSLIILFLFIFPYIIQINYGINSNLDYGIKGDDVQYTLQNIFNMNLSKNFKKDILKGDMEKIIEKYPNQTFVVGNVADDYQVLANLYWGGGVKEFVSIQDYNLYLENTNILYEKKFMPIPNIQNRRQIWFAGGMDKNENDDTDYENIEFGIGIEEPINLKEFEVVKKYESLYLSKKIIELKEIQ